MTDMDLFLAAASPFDAIKRTTAEGREWWSARELMPLLGYGADWRNFADAIERARITCRNSGSELADHFGDATKKVAIGSNAFRDIDDVALTRYAAYLTAMNGDPRKPEIAAAQTYFAVKTREAEVSRLAHQLPVSYADALRELASTVEQRDVLAAELEITAPKAQAWETLASATGDYPVADAAKILCRDPLIRIGQQRLFTLLASWDWIYRGEGQRWRPMQAQVETGRLSELPSSHYHPRTGELVLDPPQVRVTVKGLEEIRRRIITAQPT